MTDSTPLSDQIAALTPDQLAKLRSRLQHSTQPVVLPRTRLTDLPDGARTYIDGREAWRATSNQARLWFLEQYLGPNPTYNVVRSMRLLGSLNLEALRAAFQHLIQRHEALRATFHAVDGVLYQTIANEQECDWEVLDLQAVPESDRDRRFQEQLKRWGREPFDLTRDGLLRVRVVTLSDREFGLQIVIHHIVSDGWTFGILARELSALYRAFLSEREASLQLPPLQFADYSVWLYDQLETGKRDRNRRYWEKQLGGHLPTLDLPCDRPRSSEQTFKGKRAAVHFSQGETQALKNLAHRSGASLFMVLLASFQVLLYRYTHQTDIIVGTPIANRSKPEFEGIWGYLVDNLPLRTDMSGNPRFVDLLARVRQTALDAYARAHPFADILDSIRVERQLNRPPLISVMMSLQNTPAHHLSLPNIQLMTCNPQANLKSETSFYPKTEAPISSYIFSQDIDVARFDQTILLREDDGEIFGVLEYNCDLFDADTIDRFITHWKVLLHGILTDPHCTIDRLPLLSHAERNRVVSAWNQTETTYPQQSVHRLFEAQVDRAPEAIAVECGDRAYTYRELNERANQLAHHLQTWGVGSETLVGVYLERSVETIIAFLGILKAGGAYVPLDLEYPPERLIFMLEDTQVPVLLTQASLLDKLPTHSSQTLCLDRGRDLLAQQSRENLAIDVKPEDLAYVIYTSGSTGKPKGVSVVHRGIVRLLFDTNYIQIDSTDAFAQVSNTSFDAATFEIWGALLHGGKLVIVPREIFLSPRDFAQMLCDCKIGMLFLTTALFNQLAGSVPQAFSSLKYLLFGGEAVDPQWVRKVLEEGPPEHLLHVYGPTESTTFATWYEVRDVPLDATTLPIGRPIANTRAYVLDRSLAPTPIGVSGELYIGGDGLARGYLNRPELTPQRWIESPFQSEGKLYKTGDRVRWLADGAIEFLGRFDHQVKIRGFRIELGEIDHAIAQLNDLEAHITVIREDDPGQKRIVTYAIPKRKTDVTPSELRDRLKDKLPKYMIPSAFVLLDSFPLTPNGKIDRKAFPIPDLEQPVSATIPPRNEVERTLVGIWQSLLNVESIGIHDDFFDLGGHSLLAVELLALMERKADIQLSINQLFELPTIAAIAASLKRQTTVSQTPCLVPLQTSECEQSPLFLIHAIGSSILFYRPLIERLQTQRTIYGIQSALLKFPTQTFNSLEAIAACYVQQIRHVQPEGPYAIGGASFGGLVAYEVARQLTLQRQTIEFAILFDRSAPGSYQRASAWRRYWHYWQQCLALGPSYLAKKLKRRWHARSHRLPQEFERDRQQLARKLDRSGKKYLSETIIERQSQLADCYQPKPYSGEIVLIRAQQGRDDGSVREPDLGWSKYALGGVRIWENPGKHMSIFKTPHVDSLARTLNVLLNETSP